MTISHLVSGAINWDKTIFVQKFPKIGEEVQVERVIDFPGGKGANVAVSSARILGKDKVVLFGALGSDLIAKEHLEILRKDGVITDLIQFTLEASSGQAYIIVDSYGRNSIMTFKKANDILTDRMVETENVLSTIRSSSLVTVIDPPLAVAKKLILILLGVLIFWLLIRTNPRCCPVILILLVRVECLPPRIRIWE